MIVPACEKMPFSTLEKIFEIASNGATIIFESLPLEANGLQDSKSDKIKRMQIFLAAKLNPDKKMPLQEISLSKGKIYVGNIEEALSKIKMEGEELTKIGLKFIKRNNGQNATYFISNNTAKDIDEKIELITKAPYVTFTNPLNGVNGVVPFEKTANGVKGRMQLKSGESIIVSCMNGLYSNATAWKYTEPAGTPINLENNKWDLHFTEGGSILPKDKTMNQIQPWTNFAEDSTTETFSGTGVYTTSFTIANKADDYLLQLDKLYESARVIVNGKDAGIVWSLPYELKIGKYIKQGENKISIEVCNLMANRIRQMDKNGEVWRNYHEINFVNINYKPFDASNWKVMPSGLDGEIKLIPLK
jgi:hypothetical protein